MNKICIVGNSHAGSLKLAASRYAPRNIAFDFYAMPGREMPKIFLRDGLFYPIGSTFTDGNVTLHPRVKLRSSVGASLDVTPFDALLISALSPTAPSRQALENGDHILSAIHCHEWLDGIHQTQVSAVSEQFFIAALMDVIQDLGVCKFLKQLSGLYKGPVVIQLVPPVCDTTLEDETWPLRQLWGDKTQANFASYQNLVRKAAEATVAQYNLDCHILSSVYTGRLPDTIDAKDTMRGDPWHAGWAYGRKILHQAVTLVRTLEKKKVAPAPVRVMSKTAAE